MYGHHLRKCKGNRVELVGGLNAIMVVVRTWDWLSQFTLSSHLSRTLNCGICLAMFSIAEQTGWTEKYQRVVNNFCLEHLQAPKRNLLKLNL